MFERMDTTHLTGDLEKDTQFVRDNLSANDNEVFRRAIAKIMSEANDTMATEGESND